MATWKECFLGDLITFQRGHDLPKSNMKEGKFPVVGSNGIIGYHNEYTTNSPSITVGRSGNVGKPFIYYGKSWSHNTTLYVKQFHNSDPVFIYYFLQTLSLENFAGGSAVPTLNRNHIHSLLVCVPEDVEEQRKIGACLKIFDDKIKINSEINNHLSDGLSAFYRQQFCASSEPGYYGCLADICQYSTEKIPVSQLNTDNYFSTENILPGKAGALSASSLPNIKQTTRCRVGDTLISNIRPYFKKIIYNQVEGGCSTDVLCMVPKRSNLSAYIYCTLYADQFFDFMVAGSKGTKMPRGDKQQIMTYAVHFPTETELESFNAVAVPTLALINVYRDENIRLAALRDAILPRLMCGDIDISDIDL